MKQFRQIVWSLVLENNSGRRSLVLYTDSKLNERWQSFNEWKQGVDK